MSTDPGPAASSGALDQATRTSWRDALSIYARPKLMAMLFLGFSAGLPFLLVYGTLSAWLREAGVSRTAIGFFVWLGLFYTLKWLWAPLIDRVRLPGLDAIFGQRRSWMLLAQAGLIVGMIGVGASNPQTSLMTLALFALVIAFSSATQDVAIDAWRIESVDDDAQAAMAANYQLGYRFGLMTAQTGALAIAGFFSPNDPTGGEIYTPHAWSLAYWAMAGLVLVGSSTVLWAGEPARERAGEGRWPRTDNLSANLLKALVLVVVVIAAVLGVMKLLPFAGVLAGPLGALFGPPLRLAVAAPAWILYPVSIAGLLATAVVWRAPRNVALAFGVVLTALVYASFVHLLHDAGGEGADLATAATRAIPLLIALIPFALAVAVTPAAMRLAPDSPWLTNAAAGPVLEFFRRFGWAAMLVLAIVATYRISDFTMGVMAKPLYIDLGYDKETIGLITGVFGLWVGIAGAFLAGIGAMRFGLIRCLVAGAVLTIVTNLSFAWLAAGGAEPWRLVVAIALDNSAGGFAGGVFIAYMSRLTNTAFTATQYALFSSLYAIYGKTLAGFSGVLADAVGYVWFFAITAGFGVPAFVLTLVLLRSSAALRGDTPAH